MLSGDERGIGAVSRTEDFCPRRGGALFVASRATPPPRPRPRFGGTSASATMSVTRRIEFEDPAGSIARLRSAGIGIFKLQPRPPCGCQAVDRETLAQLKRFDEGVSFAPSGRAPRQWCAGALPRPRPAFAEIERAYGNEWRVHCHVPVFMDRLPHLDTHAEFPERDLWPSPALGHYVLILKSRPIPSTSCRRSCVASMWRPPWHVSLLGSGLGSTHDRRDRPATRPRFQSADDLEQCACR